GLPDLANAALPQTGDADELREPPLGLAQHGRHVARHRPDGTEERVVFAVDLGVELLDLVRPDPLLAEEFLDADGAGEFLVGDQPRAERAQTEAAVLRA